MNTRWFVVSVALLAAGVGACEAAIIAEWTFETSQPSGSGQSITGISPEVGSGSASGYHSSSSTTWDNPVGNGSGESFSANYWAIGGYFQFQSSSLGYRNTVLTWDQTRSSTGPTNFMLSYSTDGSSFVDAYSYTVANKDWSSSSYTSASHNSLDLSSVTSLNNASSIYFRLVATTAPGGTSGTSRNDNFTISADVVPEPVNVALVVFGGIAGTAWAVRRFVFRRKE